MILSFLQQINRFKNQLPFAYLVESNNNLRAFIQKEWEEKHKANSFHFLGLESIKRLLAVQACKNAFREPLREGEDRIKVANSLTQNMISSLRKLNNRLIEEILIHDFLDATEVEAELVELSFFSKNFHRPKFDFNGEVKALLTDYKVLKGHADFIFTKQLDEQAENTVSQKSASNAERLWFKVGLEFAKGTIQELHKKGDSGLQIANSLGNINFRPYITETLSNTTISDKNIYGNENKMESIRDYCNKNKIELSEDFISNLDKLKSINLDK